MAKAPTIKDKSLYIWAVTRVSLGLIMLWAFFDKLLGLGNTTCLNAQTNVISVGCEKAWIHGGSPTVGFLKFATKGPFESFYQHIAGNRLVDVLFMAGLFLIGAALVAGIGMKIATISGALLMVMMWTAVLPPENHPFLDDHIIYALVLLGLLASNTNQKWGLRSWWARQPLVRRFPILE